MLVGGGGLRQGHQRGRILRHMGDAGGDAQPRAVPPLRPVQPGLPFRLLAAHQGGGGFGAVAQQVGLGVAGEFQHHRLRVDGDAFLRGAGKPGQRQVGIGHLATLGPAGGGPFGGHGLGQLAVRQQ